LESVVHIYLYLACDTAVSWWQNGWDSCTVAGIPDRQLQSLGVNCLWQEICRYWSNSFSSVFWRFTVNEWMVRLCYCALPTWSRRHFCT